MYERTNSPEMLDGFRYRLPLPIGVLDIEYTRENSE